MAGRNAIKPIMGGCVLHENWRGSDGVSGESFNSYDAARDLWHQSWVDMGGSLLLLEGRYADGAMTLSDRHLHGKKNSGAINEIKWTREGEGNVRQLWRVSADAGVTWTILFDGLYSKRRSEPPTPTATGREGLEAGSPTTAALNKLFIVQFTTGSAWDDSKSPSQQVGMSEHSANLARLRREGKLVAGARYQDSVADKGMVILRATDREALDADLVADPMLLARRFNADVAEFKPFYDGFIARPRRVDASKPLSKFAWLAGCWEGSAGTTSFREHWMPETANLMMAMSRTTRAGKLLSHESIRLELDADGVTPVYVATPSGQKETRFKLASTEEGKFVFENPLHDFPQRVVYRQNPDGSLAARIEGVRAGTPAASDFPMKRANCE